MKKIWQAADTLDRTHPTLRVTYAYEHGDADLTTTHVKDYTSELLTPAALATRNSTIGGLIEAIENAVEEINDVSLNDGSSEAEDHAIHVSKLLSSLYGFQIRIPTEDDAVYDQSDQLASMSIKEAIYITDAGVEIRYEAKYIKENANV